MVNLDTTVRVGDTIDSLWLGEMARGLNAMHLGLVDGSYSSAIVAFGGQDRLRQTLPLYTRYVFSNGYKRKPPYIVIATVSAGMSTQGITPATYGFGLWVTRWPHISRASLHPDGQTGFLDWNEDGLDFNTQLNNFEHLGEPDAYGYGNDGTIVTAYKVFEEELSQRSTYTNGEPDAPYDEYIVLTLGLLTATHNANNQPIVLESNISILGGG